MIEGYVITGFRLRQGRLIGVIDGGRSRQRTHNLRHGGVVELEKSPKAVCLEQCDRHAGMFPWMFTG